MESHQNMIKKKRTKSSRRQKLSKPARMKDAQEWVKDYEGRVLVQKYKKRYGLDSIVKAVDELTKLGAKLDYKYVNRIKKSVENNISHAVNKKESKEEQRVEMKVAADEKAEQDALIEAEEKLAAEKKEAEKPSREPLRFYSSE